MREDQRQVVERDICDVLLQYTCAAYPPEGISAQKAYSFGRDKDGFYFSHLEEKTYADLEYIKMLFTPKGKTWAEIVK